MHVTTKHFASSTTHAKCNKAVSTEHLKVENYSIILQKEFVYYGKQAACFAGYQYISSNDAKTWPMIQSLILMQSKTGCQQRTNSMKT